MAQLGKIGGQLKGLRFWVGIMYRYWFAISSILINYNLIKYAWWMGNESSRDMENAEKLLCQEIIASVWLSAAKSKQTTL